MCCTGLFMLLADASFKQMNVIGPSGLAHYLASMRTYVYRFVSGVLLQFLSKRRTIQLRDTGQAA